MNQEDKFAFIASITFAIIGLSLMYLSISHFGPTQIEIQEVDRSMIGEDVSIKGEVQSPFHTGEHLFFNLANDFSEIEVANFDTDASISDGETVEIEGRVDLHEGEINIIAEEIRPQQ